MEAGQTPELDSSRNGHAGVLAISPTAPALRLITLTGISGSSPWRLIDFAIVVGRMARQAYQELPLGREFIELGNLDIVSLGAVTLKGVTRTWETGNTSGQRTTPDAWAHVGDAGRTRTALALADRDRDAVGIGGIDELHDEIGGQFAWGPARQAMSAASALLTIGDPG